MPSSRHWLKPFGASDATRCGGAGGWRGRRRRPPMSWRQVRLLRWWRQSGRARQTPCRVGRQYRVRTSMASPPVPTVSTLTRLRRPHVATAPISAARAATGTAVDMVAEAGTEPQPNQWPWQSHRPRGASAKGGCGDCRRVDGGADGPFSGGGGSYFRNGWRVRVGATGRRSSVEGENKA